MKFCSDCFKDSEIRNIIEGINNKGKCEILKIKSDHIYDTDVHTELTPYFDALLEVYYPVALCNPSIDSSNSVYLKYDLNQTWDIFNDNCKSNNIYKIIKSICKDRYAKTPQLFDEGIVIKDLYDESYRKSHSLLLTDSWNSFKDNLIRSNRYHSNSFNTNLFEKYCWKIRKIYKKGHLFFRARISSKDGFSTSKMGVPPIDKSKSGRVNAEGIECLYLASDLSTAVSEVRPGVADFITIGTFELKKDIGVADIKEIDSISPFVEPDYDFLVEYALNKDILKRIKVEMSKIVRQNDSKLDYVPTQYICDFIKQIEKTSKDGIVNFAGVEYGSTLKKSLDSYNLAIFYPKLFKCIRTEVVQVSSLNYQTEHV